LYEDMQRRAVGAVTVAVQRMMPEMPLPYSTVDLTMDMGLESMRYLTYNSVQYFFNVTLHHSLDRVRRDGAVRTEYAATCLWSLFV
jgi:hypothetical protein